MEEKVIICKELTKQFGDFCAVDKISFDVRKGEIFGFLGANGAGKTTAMRILCGLSYPSSGEATVAGFSVRHQQESIKKNIGYMSQKFSLYENLTVVENIEFFGGVYGVSRNDIRERSDKLIQDLGLQKEAKKLVGGLPLDGSKNSPFQFLFFTSQKLYFWMSLLEEWIR